MSKWIILIILMVVMSVGVVATICEDRVKVGQNCTMITPLIACSSNYTIWNSSGANVLEGNMSLLNNSIYQFNFNEPQGDYIISLCDGTSRQIRVTSEGEDMAEVAITLFILVVTIGLFALPFFKEFSENAFVNIILKRSCWVIAIYLMMLNSAIMATIAGNAGLSLTNEMFNYMWLFGVAGYLLMGFMVFKTILDVMGMIKIKKDKEQMGYFDDEQDHN